MISNIIYPHQNVACNQSRGWLAFVTGTSLFSSVAFAALVMVHFYGTAIQINTEMKFMFCVPYPRTCLHTILLLSTLTASERIDRDADGHLLTTSHVLWPGAYFSSINLAGTLSIYCCNWKNNNLSWLPSFLQIKLCLLFKHNKAKGTTTKRIWHVFFFFRSNL